MSDGDGGPPSGEDGHDGGPAVDGDEEPAANARSPATDPRAPKPANPRRRLVVVGVVVLMLAASIGGVAWAVTQGSDTPVEEPEATFSAQYAGNGTAVLLHEGGAQLRAGSTVVAVDDDTATWADTRFDVAPDDRIGPGDETTLVGVEPGDIVEIRYVVDGETVVVGTVQVDT